VIEQSFLTAWALKMCPKTSVTITNRHRRAAPQKSKGRVVKYFPDLKLISGDAQKFYDFKDLKRDYYSGLFI
jgi:hypothetical protein